jgi:hypothetical protein
MIAIGYLVVFISIPFVLSDLVGTNLQGFLITFVLFTIFGVSGSLWIMNYAKKQEQETKV